ncbi:hypothetical protein [Companilactobacillus zhongbaensis]|uniref:hypothetical protein n=1 Tax=Companilactobacillus zhongbaensis TaxID=2486009 RepID=UPI000F798B4C|nr:hypothetical protein [Companilactobacillus zhongbaensis]
MTDNSEMLLNEFQSYDDFCNAFADNFLEGSRIVKLLISENAEIVKQGHLIDHLSGKLSNTITSHGHSSFIKLKDEEKTKEYRSLENEYRVNKIEFRELKKAYLKFLKKSQVSDLYAREDDVVDPTVETEGNFRYPVISERMRYMIFYLRENDLGDSTKARQFARERIAKLGGDSNTQVKSAIDRLFYVMNGSMAI